ncbi:unnamed protein product [Didymodactylos carnosus]|uniref:Uncharacterized protein n=1 Tax=Didymodactylos carnosus TaxID=1234261 RepID=A0A8S2RT85_9BILA|nr:unnamed protein product [Didymodactylos carnosus]CAF4181331.1 unnamed protein product [Didymodactylos carnosus]
MTASINLEEGQQQNEIKEVHTQKTENPAKNGEQHKVLMHHPKRDTMITIVSEEVQSKASNHPAIPMKSNYLSKKRTVASIVQIDIDELLKPKSCTVDVQLTHKQYLSSTEIDLLADMTKFLLSSTTDKADVFDSCFATMIDEPLDVKVLIKCVTGDDKLKVYILDSLKRYHALSDVIHLLPACADIDPYILPTEKVDTVEQFLNIADKITTRILLISTIESLSYESQRYLGHFIKKNDLPIPFSYYTYNKIVQSVQYKINFNTLAEVLCLTDDRFLLQIGSPSTVGLGKTTLLQNIFHDKRKESLNADGTTKLRSCCIDLLFASMTYNHASEKYIVFDVHGTMVHSINEEIVTAIQQYVSLQIFYVTMQDLNDGSFLPSLMNCSDETRVKPTIVVIFDADYDSKQNTSEKIISQFTQQYKSHKQLFI